MIAPTATCVVAMSAALLLQIVHAPNVIWQSRRNSHTLDNLRSAMLFARVRAKIQNATIAIAIMAASARCAI